MWTNYIRLVDQLIRAYNEARLSLLEAVQEPDNIIGPLFRASNQLEDCLGTLRPAVRFARRLRLKRDCPGCSALSVTSDDALDRLNRIIQAIEALEERVLGRGRHNRRCHHDADQTRRHRGRR